MAIQNQTVRPALADAYFDWQAETTPTPPASIGGTAATAATGDWGPVNQVVELDSYDEYLLTFGDSDTELRRAVYGAFKGQGVNGQGGASTVMAYRQATGSAAKATHTLMNTAGTPASAVTLTAKYPGSRANSLRLTVQASSLAGHNDLLVLDGAVVVERYTHTVTDLAGLVAQINDLSDWFDALLVVDGTGLALVSAVALSGGVDGNTILAADWTATEAAFDVGRWSVFAAYNLTDSSIRASLVAWTQARNSQGRRCFLVLGGVVDETLTTAASRSTAINDYNVINLGEGRLHLTDDDRDCSTAEFVTRYAGARCWRGEARDDIFVRFADVELVSGASLQDQQDALSSGVVVFSRDTDPVAPVFIREAVNTYTSDISSPVDGQGNKFYPVRLYKRIKNVAIQHGIEQEVQDWARSGSVLGDLPVNDKTRALVLGRVQIAYAVRETAQIVQPGWTVADAPGQSDDDDFITYVHGFHPTRSLRQILNIARVG